MIHPRTDGALHRLITQKHPRTDGAPHRLHL